MSLAAKTYIFLVSAMGAAIVGYALVQWSCQDWVRFGFYLLIALIASGMKVSLPSVMGTMSMNFLFVLLGIAELSRPETLAIGCLGMLVQCLFHAKVRPQPVQVMFSVASVACSIMPAWAVYHSALLAPRLETPMKLILAAGAYFITNTLSISLVIAVTEGKRAWRVWREAYVWTFPNYLVGAAVAWIIGATSKSFGWQTSLLLVPVLYVVYRSHKLYVDRLEEEKRRAEDRRIHAEEVSALHRRTIEVLALAVEAKDQTTHDHLRRVEIYSVGVGKELGLSETEIEAVRASALLHDIGKLAVPEYIISKPGKLTPDEFEKMKTHTVVGAEIVEQIRFPYAVAPIVRSHHEKWDGSGYPDGLSGERIPIGARILSAVDCLDALASDRQYRRALPLDEAIAVVQSQAGTSFDPKVVAVLGARYRELERMAKSGPVEDRTRLSTDVKIERGLAPAAGFESSMKRPEPHAADLAVQDGGRDLVNFHDSIAEAERHAGVLKDITESLDAQVGAPAAFAILRDKMQELIPCASLVVYEIRNDRLAAAFVDGENHELFASLEIPMGMGLSGWVAENRKPIVNGNPSVEPGYLNDPTKFSILRSALAVPLETGSSIVGVLALYRRGHDAFTTEHLSSLLFVGDRLAQVLEESARALR